MCKSCIVITLTIVSLVKGSILRNFSDGLNFNLSGNSLNGSSYFNGSNSSNPLLEIGAVIGFTGNNSAFGSGFVPGRSIFTGLENGLGIENGNSSGNLGNRGRSAFDYIPIIAGDIGKGIADAKKDIRRDTKRLTIISRLRKVVETVWKTLTSPIRAVAKAINPGSSKART